MTQIITGRPNYHDVLTDRTRSPVGRMHRLDSLVSSTQGGYEPLRTKTVSSHVGLPKVPAGEDDATAIYARAQLMQLFLHVAEI